MFIFRTLQPLSCYVFFFFFNDTATTEIYTLSLHDALPIFAVLHAANRVPNGPSAAKPSRIGSQTAVPASPGLARSSTQRPDRKSTRLNSSHDQISYAVFCLKKKKKENNNRHKQIAI